MRVEVEVGRNEDPAALGCPELAGGFPWSRATVSPPARGYADWLGWVQTLAWELIWEGFQIDPFLPLGDGTHPFCFYGFSPTLFDAPHTDVEVRDSDFVAHCFLCGLRRPGCRRGRRLTLGDERLRRPPGADGRAPAAGAGDR